MPDSSSLSPLVAGHNRFGFDLFAAATGRKGNENVVLSPTSLLFALGMTWNGAAGATREEMARGLGIADVEDANAGFEALRRSLLEQPSGVDIAAADSLWVSRDISLAPAFRDLCHRVFGATVESVDFSDPGTRQTIVDWALRETRGKIDLSESPFAIGPETDLLLVDAIFFQGHWTRPFDPGRTREASFTLPNGRWKSVPLMRVESEELEALEESDFQAVRLPYGKKDRRFVFEVYLPAKGKSFRKFLHELTADRWESLGTAFQPTTGSLALPRFACSWGASLGEPLAALGMKTAFGHEADFTSMAPGMRFISQVVHKARIEVDEQGTTAAAVTMNAFACGVPDFRFQMHVDRPFFWAIRDLATGAALFLGVVADPTAG